MDVVTSPMHLPSQTDSRASSTILKLFLDRALGPFDKSVRQRQLGEKPRDFSLVGVDVQCPKQNGFEGRRYQFDTHNQHHADSHSDSQSKCGLHGVADSRWNACDKTAQPGNRADAHVGSQGFAPGSADDLRRAFEGRDWPEPLHHQDRNHQIATYGPCHAQYCNRNSS